MEQKEIYIVNERSNAAAYGIGSFLREYIDCLKKMNFKINLIELNSEQTDFYITEIEGIKKFIFPYTSSGNFEKYYKSISRIFRFHIKDSKNLIFHLNYGHCEALVDQIRSSFPLSKIILTIHYQNWTWPLDGDSQLFEKIVEEKDTKKTQKKYASIIDVHKRDKSILEKVDYITCLSKDTYDLIRKVHEIEEDKLHLIQNGLRDSVKQLTNSEKLKLRKKLYLDKSEKIILYVGRLDKMKGIFSLMSCFGNILKVYPNSRLVIIGAAGNLEYSINACKNIGTKITFTGKLSQEELAQWYQIADIGLFPSYSEECSYVGIEMMMHGLPIIASDGRGVACMFQHESNAIVAPIGNRKSKNEFSKNLEKAILDLLSSDSMRKQLSDNAKSVYNSAYNIDSMAAKYEKLFHKL